MLLRLIVTCQQLVCLQAGAAQKTKLNIQVMTNALPHSTEKSAHRRKPRRCSIRGQVFSQPEACIVCHRSSVQLASRSPHMKQVAALLPTVLRTLRSAAALKVLGFRTK
jgi:hypothetical protein